MSAVTNPSTERPRRPYLIGVAGGSNSGKTTISERLATLMGGDQLSLIRLDSYYIARTDEPIEVRAQANYDHPDAFDWELLNDHLAALTAGASVEVPVYDFTIHDRSDRSDLVPPAKVVVVEGILVLWEPRLRERHLGALEGCFYGDLEREDGPRHRRLAARDPDYDAEGGETK